MKKHSFSIEPSPCPRPTNAPGVGIRLKSWDLVPGRTVVNLVELVRSKIGRILFPSRGEEKLKSEQLRRLSRAVEQIPVSVIIADLSGRIEYTNPAFTEATGYSAQEALGKNARLLNSGNTPPEENKRLWDTITAGREWRGEFLNKAKDGSLYWESSVISPIMNQAGKITHFLAVNENITHRKCLEDQLRQAQKMEAVGQLVSGVAHDFNNILVANLMNLGMLQRNPLLSAETKESLREVERETVRAAHLARQLLMFSRRQPALTGPIELNVVVHNLLSMLRRLLGENIEIITHYCPDAIWMSADEGMMEQVVMNLCINARDAMPKGGKLTISTRRVDLEDEHLKSHPGIQAGHAACLSVHDNGCGMSKAVLAQIFEPFFTTKRVGMGTGLGLATVNGIVKHHEGWIEVKSVVGGGSSFEVFLPATKPPVIIAIPGKLEETPGGSETILLVEDEAFVRRLVALSLRDLGYAVLEAASGLEAVDVWEHNHEKIGLLFTDTLMPGNLTGMDLATRFRKQKRSLKVISSSGYRAAPTAAAVALRDDITLLPKPYTPAVLAKTVRHCLDHN